MASSTSRLTSHCLVRSKRESWAGLRNFHTAALNAIISGMQFSFTSIRRVERSEKEGGVGMLRISLLHCKELEELTGGGEVDEAKGVKTLLKEAAVHVLFGFVESRVERVKEREEERKD